MAKTYQGTKLQDLGNLEVLDPTDKIVIVKPKDEGVMELKEFFFYVQQNLDLSNYYTTVQANARFAEKSVVYTKSEADARFAFLDRVYSKVQSDTKYALKDDTFTKDEADTRFAGIDFSYSKTELYTKDETFITFALKTEIPPVVDLSPYSTTAKGDIRWAMKNDTYTKIDSDGRFAPLEQSYPKAESDGRYAKAITTYTKEETDSKFIDVDEGYTRTFIQNNIYFKPELYTRLESDNRFALKNNVYTVSAINEQFASKSWVYSRGDAEATFAPITTTYTKTEINTLLDTRINPVTTNLTTNYYNKDNTDTKFATKALTYSRVESDGKYALISNTLTETQLVAKYYDKIQVDAKFAAIDWTPYLTKTVAAATYATKDTTLTKTAIETTYYTKAQVDDAIAAAEQGLETGSAERYITSAYAEERYANVNSVYTKTESDSKYATLALTYSRIDSDARYFLKGEVTTAINDKATQTLGTVATNYLTKADATSTYITIANANNTLANKTTVYTKTESDGRYAPKDSSYLKAVSDSLYLKVGLDALSVVSTTPSGSGAVLNLNNTNASNLESGRVVWNNETHSIGNLRITNTATSEAYFTLDLRPNFVTNPAKTLTVTPTYIEHGSYGKLHTYFATAGSVYDKPIIDSLFSEIRADYVTTSTANSRFALASGLSALDGTVATLSNRVTTDRTYLDNNYYKKTEVYTKAETDAKYYNSSTSNLLVSGTGTNVALTVAASGSAYKTGNLHLNYGATTVASIYSYLNSEDAARSFILFAITNAGKTGTEPVMTVGREGINHTLYGDLHTYFAKSSETYTKTEMDATFEYLIGVIYTRDMSDALYPSKGEFTTLTGRVTTEEGKLTALTTNLSNNYHAKTLVYTKTESDGRYVSSKSNVITLAPNAGDTNTLALHIAAPTGATTLGGIKWSRGSEVYTLNALIDGDNKGKLQFGKVSGSSVLAYFLATDTGLWHTSYGDLHTYFAKSSEYYSKTEADGRYPLKAASYTKAESDAKYPLKAASYTKAESDARYYGTAQADAKFALKTDDYTKAESDARYYQKSAVYTKTETDAKFYDITIADVTFALKTDAYTKAQSDANYHKKTVTYTRTEMDARYPLKAASYTKAESDGKYPLIADVYTKVDADAKFYDTNQSNALFASKTDVYTKAQGDARYVYRSDLGTDLAKLKIFTTRQHEVVRMPYNKTLSYNYWIIATVPTAAIFNAIIKITVRRDSKYQHFIVRFKGTGIETPTIDILDSPGALSTYRPSFINDFTVLSKSPYNSTGAGLTIFVEEGAIIVDAVMTENFGYNPVTLLNTPVQYFSNDYSGPDPASLASVPWTSWTDYDTQNRVVPNESGTPQLLGPTYSHGVVVKNNVDDAVAKITEKSLRFQNTYGAYVELFADGGTALGINSSSTSGSIFTVDKDLIYHKAYGLLHTYFAKATDVYSKTAADGRYTLKTSYSKVFGSSGTLISSTEVAVKTAQIKFDVARLPVPSSGNRTIDVDHGLDYDKIMGYTCLIKTKDSSGADFMIECGQMSTSTSMGFVIAAATITRSRCRVIMAAATQDAFPVTGATVVFTIHYTE